MNMREADYRRTLTKLRARIAIIENCLREKDYTFNYESQPSYAMMKYRDAFLRNDETRYKEFLNRVESGEAKLNTGTLYPYDVVRNILSSTQMNADQRHSLDVTWNALEGFFSEENAIAVVDGSGSMYSFGNPCPAEVALSLGVYFAEHNQGAFGNHFITFSETPRLVEIKGSDIYEKFHYCMSFNEAANTNLRAVFSLILSTAQRNKLSQSELPDTIYIISDMEFDVCIENAESINFEVAKLVYKSAGYTLPKVVFWNVQSRNEQQPVRKHESGSTLVSGASARIFSMLASGSLTPIAYMLETLNSSRYDRLVV